MDFSQAFAAAQANLPIFLIVVLLIALGWLYRDGRQRDREHLATAMQIAPLAAKLVTCVEILERVTNANLSRRDTGGGA